MRAIFFEGFGKPLQLIETDVPTPGDGEIVIKVARCGIYGSDAHLTMTHGYFQKKAF